MPPSVISTLRASPPVLLDVRGGTPAEGGDALVRAFDGLPSGGRVLVLSDADPEPLLRRLQRDRPRSFAWAPLEEGPASWRVEVHAVAAPPGHPLSAALAWEHGRLARLAEAALAARAQGRLAEARALFDDYAHGLERHARAEDRILFPALEPRLARPATEGPTAAMREEHRAIVSLLDVIAKEIGVPGTEAETHHRELLALLRDHELKEDAVVHPALDRVFTDEEADRLLERVQSCPGPERRA